MSATLVRYDAMRTAIVAAHSVDEVKDIRDKAAALEMYARQANDSESERKVHDIRVRAERRCGELTKQIPIVQGRRSDITSCPNRTKSAIETKTKVLEDAGVTKKQAALWEKLAEVPEAEFEEELANPVALPTASHIVATHEARSEPPRPKQTPVDDKALWLWGRLLDFDRQGLLASDPNELLSTMLDHMRETTLEMTPRVIAWLERLHK